MAGRSLGMLSLLLALLLPSPATAAAVPAARNTTTSSSSPSTLSINAYTDYTPPTYKCTKVGLFRSDKRPSWPECYRAIRTLPQGHKRGAFHSQGYYSPYRLPQTEKFGRCRAQVELEGVGEVLSSWSAITAALDRLSILCRRNTKEGERTAGWMLVEPADRIKVSLLGPDDPYSGVGGVFLNGTGGGFE